MEEVGTAQATTSDASAHQQQEGTAPGPSSTPATAPSGSQYGKGRRPDGWRSIRGDYLVQSGTAAVKRVVAVIEHKYGPMALLQYQVGPSPPLIHTHCPLNRSDSRTEATSASPTRCWPTAGTTTRGC
jgi:hypothetical protein